MKTYTDPRLLDVAGAVDALPDLSLESITATESLRRTGTDDAILVAPSLAPTLAPKRVQNGQNGAKIDPFESATASDDETKKPLDSQGKQGLFDNRGDTIRTCGLYVPNEKDTPKRTNKNIGKRNTQGDGCTNGCTCDRCLLAIADALKGRLSNDERRKLAVLLLQ
jgi:hypothetical protein